MGMYHARRREGKAVTKAVSARRLCRPFELLITS
jgi:hypothetical protein